MNALRLCSEPVGIKSPLDGWSAWMTRRWLGVLGSWEWRHCCSSLRPPTVPRRTRTRSTTCCRSTTSRSSGRTTATTCVPTVRCGPTTLSTTRTRRSTSNWIRVSAASRSTCRTAPTSPLPLHHRRPVFELSLVCRLSRHHRSVVERESGTRADHRVRRTQGAPDEQQRDSAAAHRQFRAAEPPRAVGCRGSRPTRRGRARPLGRKLITPDEVRGKHSTFARRSCRRAGRPSARPAVGSW